MMGVKLLFIYLLFLISHPSLPSQEIPLSEILQVEPFRDFSNLAQGSNPHCFEIITATMVYYVGENNGSLYHSPVLAASGVGVEVAQGWEKAIRQALMPVTPQPSVACAAGQGKDHSKMNLSQNINNFKDGLFFHSAGFVLWYHFAEFVPARLVAN